MRVRQHEPVVKARIAGLFYLLSIVFGIYGALFARGNAVLVANLLGTLCYIPVTLLLYALLKPVNTSLSATAALFSLAGCVVSILGFLHLPTPGISSLVFFGVYCLLLAYLIYKSTFLPRTPSVLLTITGLGWLTFLSPDVGRHLFTYTMFTGIIGEGGLTFWLLAFGVNERRWYEQAK